MEKSVERETQDFMNVESFSQLPFIRPAPPPVNKEKGIRLFGIEFSGGSDPESVVVEVNNNVCENGNSKEDVEGNSKGSSENAGSESNRRFECHYCCRNFPTSQALGGHQNAHKRERQHAKREHLQSVMVHGGLVSHDVYGLMNYSRLGHHHHPSSTYPSWNPSSYSSTATHPSRFYGSSSPSTGTGGGSISYGTQSAPINGSPLGLWRIPSSANPSNFNHDRPLMNPLVFAGEELMKPVVLSGSSNPNSNTQSHYVYESTTVSTVQQKQQDHVSLDLHL